MIWQVENYWIEIPTISFFLSYIPKVRSWVFLHICSHLALIVLIGQCIKSCIWFHGQMTHSYTMWRRRNKLLPHRAFHPDRTADYTLLEIYLTHFSPFQKGKILSGDNTLGKAILPMLHVLAWYYNRRTAKLYSKTDFPTLPTLHGTIYDRPKSTSQRRLASWYINWRGKSILLCLYRRSFQSICNDDPSNTHTHCKLSSDGHLLFSKLGNFRFCIVLVGKPDFLFKFEFEVKGNIFLVLQFHIVYFYQWNDVVLLYLGRKTLLSSDSISIRFISLRPK